MRGTNMKEENVLESFGPYYPDENDDHSLIEDDDHSLIEDDEQSLIEDLTDLAMNKDLPGTPWKPKQPETGLAMDKGLPRTPGKPKQPETVPGSDILNPGTSGKPKHPPAKICCNTLNINTNRNSGKPKESKIDEFYSPSLKSFEIDGLYTKLDKREKFQRKCFKKSKDTLNTKISHGLRAGDLWTEKMTEQKKELGKNVKELTGIHRCRTLKKYRSV